MPANHPDKHHRPAPAPTSPHVFALEDGAKRWIKDIATFQAQGYVWEDIQLFNCEELERMPDGPPIPEDAGRPPS